MNRAFRHRPATTARVQGVTALVMTAVVLAVGAAPAMATVAREEITVLDVDGRSYTRYRTFRSDRAEPSVLDLATDIATEDSLFIVPSDYSSTRLDDGRTRLSFDDGSYAVMTTGHLDREIATAANGDLVFSSKNGGADGRADTWTFPGGFTSFAYSWIVPANIEIMDFRANRAGEWRKRGRALSWRGEQVNDIAFTIRYRVEKADDRRAETGPAASEQTQRPRTSTATILPLPKRQRMRALTRGRSEQAESPTRAEDPLVLRTAPANTLDFRPPLAPDPAPVVRGPEPKREPHSLQLERVAALDADGRPMITARGDRVLAELARTLADSDARRIRVTGPAIDDSRDTGGSAALAARVGDYLIDHDIADDKISTGAGSVDGPGNRRSVRITVEPGYAITGFVPEKN